ncbi:MAG: efflux RND transporter permease subunit [Candidatus Binatia bacterium]
MNLSAPFIRRPVATTLIMLAIFIFGMVAYRALPVSDLPNVDLPTLLVTASLPGANPETMASAVATPLERQFSTIAGLTSINSMNTLGATQITLQFELNRNIDAAAQDVQAMITQASPLLPPDMPNPPTYRKVNPADQPIMFIALTSATLPLYTLNDYGETLLAQRISMVSGVAQVAVYGAQKYAVRVQLDPRALASRGIGIDQIEQAVQAANVNLPTGTLYGAQRALTVQASGQLLHAAAYRPVIVAYRNGSPVRLDQLGQVIDGVENDKTAAWYGDNQQLQRSIVLAVLRQPGTNTVAVAHDVGALLPAFKRWLPPAVDLRLLSDRSESIRDSINEVKFTLLLALILVVMVIFLFLRNVSVTMIPSLALPLSIIGTFAAMSQLGYSLDNLSMMALVLCIGFVVDDAIVVLENIVRHMEMGESPMAAALNGSREISFTILSMTLSLAAVFIPVLFLPGILGRLFHEFAVVICVAILLSGVVSLTLTPMLCGRVLRPPEEVRHGAFYRSTERAFAAMLHLYERSLRAVLRHRGTTMAVSLAILVLTAYLFTVVPKGFIPDADDGMIFGVTEAAQGVSFDEMRRLQRTTTEIVRRDPRVATLFSSALGSSASAGSTPNLGRMFIHLKPRSERGPIGKVVQDLRRELAGIAGLRVFLQQMPNIRFGGQLTKSLYQFTLQSPNTQELYESAQRFEARMREVPDVQDVTSDLQIANPQINVVIDRDKASTLGVTAEKIENALYDAYGDRWISTIYAPDNQYKVILELQDDYQRDPGVLSMLYVTAASGQLVRLDAVARFSQGLGPMTINHAGQLPAVTLSFNLRPGAALGDAVDRINALARRELPGSIITGFQGTAQAFQSSLAGLWTLLVLAIVVIYIVLGILYESFVHPVTILSGLPSAGFGALLTLLLLRLELNIYAFVGLIMLIGIVKKNAIMQIDFALQAQRTEGKDALDAIYEGCLIRFRPIMMTTMAALLGALPIAFGMGAGAEARRSLGVVVVGGLVFSQLITLYLTPVYYLYLEALVERLRRRRHRRRLEPGAVLT